MDTIKQSKLDTCCDKFCAVCCMSRSASGRNGELLKAVSGTVFGIIFSVVYYLFVLRDMELGEPFTTTLGIASMVLLAIGNATSSYVRCVCLLTVPSICGRTGRGVLKTFALALVVSGPMANLALNGKEVVRVFGCSTQLMYNLTKTRYQLLVGPFQEALKNMKHDEKLVMESLDTVQDVADPLVKEIEGQEEVNRLKAESDYIDAVEGDSLRSREIDKKYEALKDRRRAANNGSEDESEFYEMEYKRKIEYRCEGIVNKGTERCRELFAAAYDKCKQKISAVVSWLLCWPMKLTFMCNLVSVFGGSSICDPSHVIQPGFGKGYYAVKNARKSFRENLGDVKVKYFVKGTMPKVDMKGAVASAQSAMKDFEATKSWFDTVRITLKRFFGIVFLFVMYRAAKYEDDYLSDIEFDNKYVTRYFLKLDRRQRDEGRPWLLPMKAKEMEYLVNPYTIFPDRAGICTIIRLTLLLILQMLPAITFFLLDWLLYEMLDIIGLHALVKFTQTGEHYMKIRVKGGGFVANLVRSLVKNLNVHQTVHVEHSNVTCLPRPTKLQNYFIYKVFGIYLLVWILIVIDAYTKRLNRFICSHFYPKREKRRVLYLYNETLRARVRQYNDVMDNIEKRIEQTRHNMEANWLLMLRLHRPKKFGWLRWFSTARRECFICAENEPFNLKGKFVECPTPECYAVYCLICWYEIGGFCYNCQHVNRGKSDVKMV